MEKIKILAIEDEAKIANLLKKVLEKYGFAVELAYDGKDGLHKAQEGNYNLVILDVMLPELNGIEVCRTLRSNNILTPVIMLTARDTIEDRMSAIDAGANDYVSKPFAFEDLLARIGTLVLPPIKISKEMKEDILARDCSEEKSAEINKRIMDHVPVSIITIDKEGNVTSANKYFKNLSKREDYWNTNVFTAPFFVRENLVDDYKKLLSDGSIIQRDNCYERNVNGEDKYLKIVAVPLLDKDGNIDGAVSMALDNTEAILSKNKLQELNKDLENKVAERTEELNQVNTQLAKVLELKSIFMADASHEMRTSLAIIQGNTELFFRDIIEDKADREATYGQIFGEIKRMTTMLTDLTLLGNSECSRQNLDFEAIDVNALIATVCKNLRVMADEKKIEIKHKKEGAKIEIVADAEQLERLLTNLIRNAIRYNKEGGFVHAWAQQEGKEIAINVQDGGIGIAKQHLPYIFERFYRVDKARSRSEGGSGLGLAICKWIAEVHGGKIDVRSKVGKGSLFSVRLPLTAKNT